MTKNAKRGMILLAVLLAVFSVIAFVIPFPKSKRFWFAYLCGVFAILFQVYIFKASFGKEDAKSRFYGFPIARVGILYLAVQLIVSIAEIALSKVIPGWVMVVVNVLIFAAAAIGCITTVTMRDEIAGQDGKLKSNVSAMRELQSIAATLEDQTDDSGLKGDLKKLAEDFRYSDPLSSEKTAALEADLLSGINELRQALTDGDTESAKQLCAKLSACLKERNRICAISK